MNLLTWILVAFGVSAQNPFVGKTLYVNPSFQKELDASITSASGTTKTTLQSIRNVGSAYWIDKKDKIRGNTTDSLEGILADAATKGELVTVILYDLPNRDCHAKASNGEICCTYNADGTCNYLANGDCADGLHEYQTEYVNPFAEVLAKYDSKIPIVVVIEPDSLPNLATNLGEPACGNAATQAAYSKGIPYAIQTLNGKAPNAVLYVDAAHGGWLGWDDNANKFAGLFGGMGVSSMIRGFSTNVANYQPIGTMCPWAPSTPTRNDYCLNNQHQSEPCCADPCRLESQWNPGNNEMNFVQGLYHAMNTHIPGFSPKFIIDSGRNGVSNMRTDCANWCNARGAGIGHVPTTDTGSDLVDALLWLKTPGESDGCTQTLPDGTACPRFDSMCASQDSIGSRSGEPRAPEAGAWFDYQIKQLADNAHLGL